MENKQDIIASARVHETDTGSPEVQVALLTARINIERYRALIAKLGLRK